MKIMGRWISAFLAFALLFSLVACSGNRGATTNNDDIRSSQDGPLRGANMITDVDGMMGRTTAYTEDGMYQISAWGEGGTNITFYDYQSRTRVYLCNRPDCTHTDESCPSWFSPEASAGGAGLFTDGKYLYFMRLGSTVEAGRPETITGTSSTVITRMDFNGDNREVALSLKSGEFIWSAFAEANGVLYFLLDSLVEENGTVTPLRQLVSYDIASQKMAPLHEFPQEMYFVGICETGFVMKSLVPQPDDTTLHTVYHYRLETDELEEVKRWTGMEIMAQAVNGYEYCLDPKTAQFTAVDLDTKEERIVADQLPLNADDEILRLGIFDGYFMYMVYEHGSNLVEDIKYYSVNLDDGGLIQNTLNFTAFNITSPVTILAENSTHFLVLYDKKPMAIQSEGPDGTPFEFESEEELIGLISKEDFWNNKPNYLPIENKDNFYTR